MGMEWVFLAVGAVLGSLVTALLLTQARRTEAAKAGREAAEAVAGAQATARAESERRAAAEARLAEVAAESGALRGQLGAAAEKIESSRALIAEQQAFVEKSRRDL